MESLARMGVFTVAVLSIGAWMTAFVSAIQLVSLREKHVSVMDLLVRGAAFFDESNFVPAAAPALRRFRAAFFAFFALTFLGVGMGLVLARVTTE